jgi:hypothetical protein
MEKLNSKGLPFGFKKEIAKRLGVHPNTVYFILQTGEKHPKWWRVMKVFNELNKG